MAKEKDIDNGFKVGDIVKHNKNNIRGYIHSFEWSGIRRAAVKTEENKGFYIISVEELELVERPEKEIKNEEGIKEGHSSKE